MESANGLSDLTNASYIGKYPPLHPFVFPFSSASNSDSSSIESRGDLTYAEAANAPHRCASENLLFYEQPSWFEDLLKDPDTPFRGLHRRSASDSFAYLEEAADTITLTEMQCSTLGYKESSSVDKNNQESVEMLSSFGVELTRDEHSPQNHAYKDSGTQAKPAGSKECKRKQHNAHRSRVRKLQYIAHLEKTVEMLKVEGSGFSSELEFLEQQNMILTMENKALRQRLESISQEQLIKQWEQGMLEREIARLQSVYHLQQQQQVHVQMHHQHKQQQKQKRNKSRDMDHQAMKNKENGPSRGGSINACAQA